jgi:hypothetical protein
MAKIYYTEVEKVLFKKILLLAAVAVSLAVFGSCGESTGTLFPDELIPNVNLNGGEEANIDKINIYVQANSGMRGLLPDEGDNQYTNALRSITRIAGNITENPQWYRFDVLWQDHDHFDEFAFPLESASDILRPDFYSFGWYLNRPPSVRNIYDREQERLSLYPYFYISRTINEINALRSKADELSVMVTNFEGHSDETEAIFQNINDYIRVDTRAVGIFAFANEGNPFYFLIFGSIREAAEFSNALYEQLRDLNPAFAFYTRGSVINQIGGNANAEKRDFSAWVRSAFEEDMNEREKWDKMNGKHLYYAVWRDNVDNAIAEVMLTINVNIPAVIKNNITWRAEVYELSVAGQESMDIIRSTGRTTAAVPNTDYSSVNLDVRLDISINEISLGEKRALLRVRLHAAHTAGLNDISHFGGEFSRLINTFNRINTARNEDLAADIYIHFIIR